MPTGKKEHEHWQWLSRYIRLKYTQDGYCYCVTCGRRMTPKGAQTGHLYPKGRRMKYRGIEFEESNLAPQCGHCNLCMQDTELIERFERDRIKRYGPDVLDKLKVMGRQPIDKYGLPFKTEALKKAVAELLIEKGIQKWWKEKKND